MPKKPICITTERLNIIPMTEDEVRAQIETETDEDIRAAYGEMLHNYLNEPADKLWFLPWKIVLKDSGKAIGDVGFKGPQVHGTVEIGYGILPSHRQQGFMKEAGEAFVKWAFSQHDVYTVIAETTPNNKASRALLESIGFVMYANGQEGPRFMRNKPFIPYSLVILPVSLLFGLGAGLMFSRLLFGVAVGAVLGVVFGTFSDLARWKKRKELRRK